MENNFKPVIMVFVEALILYLIWMFLIKDLTGFQDLSYVESVLLILTKNILAVRREESKNNASVVE